MTGALFAAMALLWAFYFAAFGVAGPLMPYYPLPRTFALLVRYNSYFDAGTHIGLGFGMLLLLLNSPDTSYAKKPPLVGAHVERIPSDPDVVHASLVRLEPGYGPGVFEV